MLKLEERFENYYKKLEEEIIGKPFEGEKVTLFSGYIKPFIGKAITLDLVIRDGFNYTHDITKCKVNKVTEKLDLYGYYFAIIDLKIGKNNKTIYVGGYPVEPLYDNYRSDYGDDKVLNSLEGAPQEFIDYVNLIKEFNEIVHNNLEKNIQEDPNTIARRLLGNFQGKVRGDIRAKKLDEISTPEQKIGIEIDEVTGEETNISDAKWAELAEIARKYYDPNNILDDEGQYLFYRHNGEHWAVTDGETVFANAATACKFYAEGLNLDPEKEMKKGNYLYKACENIDKNGKVSDKPVQMYRTAWRYATADEILNATERADAAMWHR